jgi:tetratricopeptide (TPR) repeat protein
MKSSHVLLALAVAALLPAVSCRPRSKEITSLQRKQAEQLVSEAQFAVTLRDYVRAEDQLAKAVAVCPDMGDYWVSLGSVRVRLGQRAGAKAAYRSALAVFEDAVARNPKDGQSMLQQVSVLALLGRPDDARALLAKLRERLPDSRNIRVFVEQKQLEALLADPAFKEISL